MNRVTAAQRKAQAYTVSRNIEAEAGKIALATEWPIAQAFEQVFQDKELLARCHNIAPVETFPPDWTEPE